ncbi:C2-domain-containing protein [Mucidula mucida]|nr:C2-domain-containing protein [Mucidula mucida]
MSHLVDKIGVAIHNAKSNAHDFAQVSKSLAEEKLLDVAYVDLTFQFIGASGIPKMDVVGSADPYFVAKLDNRISMVSTVQTNTTTPVWNEIWKVKNVPVTADLHVELFDKDVGAPHDDYIGKFKTTVSPGAKEAEIEGPLFRRERGTFWLKIESTPSQNVKPKNTYTFAGPVRFSKHCSPTIGRLTNLDNARLYSTWKMYLVGVQMFFHDTHQHWNRDYKAAQSIFQGPTSIAVRSTIQAGHRMLYARSTSNGFGVINDSADFINLLHGGDSRAPTNATASTTPATNNNNIPDFTNRVKPAVYTYIISSEDDSFRFSETGAAFFVDFASKHALHSSCAETVRYSGEFHPRPECGWAKFNDDISDDQVNWELVIDNNSGTYSPDPMMLPQLKELLEYNFPGLKVYALSHEDPALSESREACRAYAMKCRGIAQDELQPHAAAGEVTLLHQVSAKVLNNSADETQ